MTYAICVFALFLLFAGPKEYKGREEYDLHSQALKAFAARDYSQALQTLAAWSSKFPESAFTPDRQLLYVQAYAAAGDPAKAIDSATPLLTTAKESITGPADRIRLLYAVTTAIPRLPEPSPQQQTIARTAATELAAHDQAPPGTSPSDWAAARRDLQTAARFALVHLAVLPAAQALKKQDCPAAETAARQAVTDYPESVQAVWQLASAYLCLSRSQPAQAPAAIYHFARAATLDPVKGMVEPAWQKSTVLPYLEKIYTQYHGADPEGLQHLKQLAAASPFPPDGFTLKSKHDIELEKQAEFESRNPELALWQRIKAALLAPDGDTYFQSNVKGALVPQLVGTLVAASPACKPVDLTVAIEPDHPEVRLHLSKPLNGKPEPGATFRWQGVPSAYTRDPFSVTLDVDPANITGLNLTPCTPPIRKK